MRMDEELKSRKVNELVDFQHIIHSMVRDDNVLIGISDLSDATGVSQTQLRYWLEKGYLKSRGTAKKKKFIYGTVFFVRMIKKYQDEGFTLASAVEHTKRHSTMIKAINKMVFDRLENVQEEEKCTLIDLGVFDPQENKHLFASVTENGTKFELH
ncbi:MerR family transcriptional regulator [Oenococcus oeni]|uniref:MerR family transcriptional regulator n=1 Tax=Oenococcus oeni TaxID=1247 RepID=UPI0004DA381A|nr:MerR family transcriptional regulator [Oenococcus oeni]KEK03007.1 MerR family transcriptional regulator [Oenococcus oeni]KER93361.1 MerR family transcriptional regulator [Oenococcus oeni]KER95686.1 MerR family transcriptional regulator [Oenococcus oeni]OIL69373.1 MerR family transcriptional regulator [Oenococcus oeni]OIM48247.1 MerR family transcriptional regulator [Oenococcus oeni]